MRFASVLSVAAAGLAVATACYQTDALGPANRPPVTRVLLTDSPFPFDSVAHVNVYVVRVDATTNPDTTVQDSGWVTVAAPHKVFDLLALQQGTTAMVGSGELSAGQYKAIRVVINADSSAVLWSGNVPAVVNWQNWGKPEVTLYALVEAPVAVPQEGADIVIDFDVGRSFLYNYFGTKEFVLLPWLRAVNAAATGTIAGTVSSDLYGPVQPLQNVSVTVYRGNPTQSIATWSAMATGHTDAQGHYRIAYLRPGTYIVRFEEPIIPALAPQTDTGVVVVTGDTTSVSTTLLRGSAAGLQLSAASSVGVGGYLGVNAFVLDSNGARVPNPTIAFTLSDTTIAGFAGESAYSDGVVQFITGKQAGWVTMRGTSGTFSDSVIVQVVSTPAPVASVAVVPADDTLPMGIDSVAFQAVLRDSLGNVINGAVPVSWSISDSTIVAFSYVGSRTVTVHTLKVGSAILQAVSQGKVGQATIVVH